MLNHQAALGAGLVLAGADYATAAEAAGASIKSIRDIITQFQTTALSKGSIVQPDVDPY